MIDKISSILKSSVTHSTLETMPMVNLTLFVKINRREYTFNYRTDNLTTDLSNENMHVDLAGKKPVETFHYLTGLKESNQLTKGWFIFTH